MVKLWYNPGKPFSETSPPSKLEGLKRPTWLTLWQNTTSPNVVSSNNVVDKKFLNNVFNLKNGSMIVESDKKLGFVVLNESTYHEAYSKINADQHFHQADITEEWYLTNIVNFIHEAEAALPRQLFQNIEAKGLPDQHRVTQDRMSSFLPKIQKLKDVSFLQPSSPPPQASIHLWI